jgi:predicted hydrolase (HD superfamily)
MNAVSPDVTVPLAAEPIRARAWSLLCAWTEGELLRRHAAAVEACVAWYGEHRFGVVDDELETWRAAALLHDFDYERQPETHPQAGAAELARLGWPPEVVEAVLGHGDHTGMQRVSLLARTLYACDEMSGFVTAVAYVRPNRSLDEVDPRAVLKKMKDRGFARLVSRDQLTVGAQEIGVPFDEHIANVVEGLRSVRDVLGL